MQAKPEFRRSERFRHESIVKLEDDLTLSPYYAVSYNLSDAGMYIKSLFEMYPGVHILMRIDDFAVSHDPVPSRVVWCRELENPAVFRFGVGVEFLQPEKNRSLKASIPILAHTKTRDSKEGGVVVRMQKRLPE
jgi:Tfp pilus assembly protein PilZ